MGVNGPRIGGKIEGGEEGKGRRRGRLDNQSIDR